MSQIKNCLKVLLSLSIVLLLWGCIDFGSDDEPFLVSPQEEEILKSIFKENNIPIDRRGRYKNTLYNNLRFKYADWPNEWQEVSYEMELSDSSMRTLVLSDKITLLRDFEAFKGIVVKCDSLDSIEIITDSVIIVDTLTISDCNLQNLPKDIGNIRTCKLNIFGNPFITLPIELSEILEEPHFYPYFMLWFDQPAWDSLSEEFQMWYTDVYVKQLPE